MKKLLFVLLILPAISLAAPIDPNIAQQVAQNFINSADDSLSAQQPINQPRRLKRVAKQTTDNPPYYIFNNEDGGFVIVSGDDCATPILGYSYEGSIDLDNMPIQLEGLLSAYAAEIQYAIDNHLQATDEVAASWTAYKRAPKAQTTTTVVSALITTSWDQAPYYNILCPSDSKLSNLGGHPSTGCVATAMAQIMKYWEYPKQGSGFHSYRSNHYGTLSANFANTTYDWKNMPLKLSSSTSSTQNNAVATLMYHCGVAVDMDYNCDGRGSSGAQIIEYYGDEASSEYALKNYFGYASTVTGKMSSSYSSSDWVAMLKNELDNSRPVLYAGFDPNGNGGHAFVCDGYDSNNKFHFNWGWSGQYNNGFFSITALTPGNYNFSKGQQAVIGIKPKDGSGPAKNYDLYMNTDLTAINTSSTGSSTDVNPYIYGNTMSFRAKVENNGTGVFNGSFRVAAFTNDGEFLAWSKESHHFSLAAGYKTEAQTFTFDGGYPFIPGKYRAYLYYKDDDEAEWKYVKTDNGVIFTEYNNVVFTVKITSGDLIPYSSYTFSGGIFYPGILAGITIDVRNTALLTKFYGKIRLNLYNTDGTLAQVIDEDDYTSSGFPSSTTYSLYFFNEIKVKPGTYYLALVYQKKNETSWYYMRSIDSYPNPVKVDIKTQPLIADQYEVNNTQSSATTLPWEIDEEMVDFGTDMVSFHEEADVDYYQLSFPDSGKYKVAISLFDKHNNQGRGYKTADAQYAYSVGGNNYSSYVKNNQVISFDGPTTLYFKVIPYGLDGLGFYELCGDVAKVENRTDCKSVPYTETFATSKGDFTIYNAVMPSGFSSIWNWDSQYGMVAKCIKGSTKYESESYLISPCIEIPMEGQTVLSFRHAAKFFQNTSQMTLWISTNFDALNPSTATWNQWPIPTYPTGQNWNWVNSGLIDISGYKGQYVNIAFKYTSTTSYAPQWEIKDFKVEPYTTDVENIHIDGNTPTKILRNGQILILRGDKTYTLTGQEVR